MFSFWPHSMFSDDVVKAICRLVDLCLQRKITHLAYLDLIRSCAAQTEPTPADIDEADFKF